MLEKIIKDYFSFSRKERIAVIILAFLILIILLLPYLFPQPEGSLKEADLKNFKNQVDQLQSAKKEQNTPAVKEERFMADHDYESNYKPGSLNKEKLLQKRELFYFDPNKLSGEGWKRLGLRDKTILTIHNYISKGGRFKNKEDIQKIYGLHTNDVERLMPYVRIDKIINSSRQENYETGFHKVQPPESYTRVKSLHPSHIIDINQADTAELIALPGIGSKLAARIVRFREKLGGFYSVDQVSEIYGLPDSTFQKIRASLTIINSKVSLININTIDVNELKQHPYIKWNIASAIVEYRKQHGNYNTLDDLRNIELFTNEVYEKIIPYLKIE